MISKPATQGKENCKGIILQSHADMVGEKHADVEHDFDKDPIETRIEDGWVKAKGTTLGADDGIGIAASMAILASDDIEHPPIEALFTVDEETGMTGAKGLEAGLLNGDILLNLDTEDDRELTIGCAGGVDVNVSGRYEPEAADSGRAAFRLAVKGLNGGHSGMDIHLCRANANKLLNRLLFRAAEESGLRIASIESGGLRNAIPREGFAVVTVAEGEADAFRAVVEAEASVLRAEYATTDPALEVALEPVPDPLVGIEMRRTRREDKRLQHAVGAGGIDHISYRVRFQLSPHKPLN